MSWSCWFVMVLFLSEKSGQTVFRLPAMFMY